MSLFPSWATNKSEQHYWQYEYAEYLETEDFTMLGSDLYLDRNTCSLSALALFPSDLFCFILFSVKNNLKTISIQLPEKRWMIILYTALALSPKRSFLFHFVLSENDLKTISIQLPEKWQMLILCIRNTSLTLNCLRIQCWDYTKRNTETNTTAVRGCDIDTCTMENPELGMFRTGTLMNCKICLAISMIVLNF